MKKIRIHFHFPAFSIAAEQWIKIHKKIRLLIQKKRKKNEIHIKKRVNVENNFAFSLWRQCMVNNVCGWEWRRVGKTIIKASKILHSATRFSHKALSSIQISSFISHTYRARNEIIEWSDTIDEAEKHHTKHFFSLDNFPSSLSAIIVHNFSSPFSSPLYAVNPVFL